mmetsp:Transcript_90972/g.199270  ORF Transcript_90972/g.199270 Transcript_90972/m.199270 type:complete len:100 (+) Transcript_90972:112-411(+)
MRERGRRWERSMQENKQGGTYSCTHKHMLSRLKIQDEEDDFKMPPRPPEQEQKQAQAAAVPGPRRSGPDEAARRRVGTSPRARSPCVRTTNRDRLGPSP